MNLIFANDQTSAPFQYATWVKTRPDALDLFHKGTLFIGEPGVPLGKLIEVRLMAGKWARAPIVSGGTLTNRTDTSVFVQVGDHANLTEFAVDLSGITGPQRVGTPIQIEIYADREHVRTITLGYIGGVSTVAVPFFNPPTNPRQQTILVLNNHENHNWVRVIAVDPLGAVLQGAMTLDSLGAIRRGDLAVLAPGEQLVLEAGAVYAAVGAEPIAGNKLRLILCASAPLTVVSKVRDSDSGILCDNAVEVIA